MMRDLERLHAAGAGKLEERILQLALERTKATSGALFVADEKRTGLWMEFHMVGGMRIERPGTFLRRRRDRANGIAMWVADRNKPYYCPDSTKDPNYTSYFHNVRSVLAVPIPYQRRAIGVISVSDARPNAFRTKDTDELIALARSSSRFLRRLQVYREWRKRGSGLFIRGLSPEWLEAERRIEQAGETRLPILIRGESGTGKELVAHAVHFNSARADQPFVTVNSAAIPETLIESTLFGHVKGAFTGASYARVGEIRKAEGGTLFLDEIGELAPSLQAKLLRFLESGEYLPLGSNKTAERGDVRLVCATNRPLEQMTGDGGFRKDLFYRISVVTIDLPPLRSFRQNLPILLDTLVFDANKKHGRGVKGFTAAARNVLQDYEFPGNMRELRNLVEQAVVLSESDWIDVPDLPPAVRAPATPEPGPVPETVRPYAKAKGIAQDAFLEDYLTRLMKTAEGDLEKAARVSKLSVPSLYRLLKRAGLKKAWRKTS